jgi:hypothetical protein
MKAILKVRGTFLAGKKVPKNPPEDLGFRTFLLFIRGSRMCSTIHGQLTGNQVKAFAADRCDGSIHQSVAVSFHGAGC